MVHIRHCSNTNPLHPFPFTHLPATRTLANLAGKPPWECWCPLPVRMSSRTTFTKIPPPAMQVMIKPFTYMQTWRAQVGRASRIRKDAGTNMTVMSQVGQYSSAKAIEQKNRSKHKYHDQTDRQKVILIFLSNEGAGTHCFSLTGSKPLLVTFTLWFSCNIKWPFACLQSG